ncbi:glycosyltransferase [Leifsonia poae]|uniref:glycosyltransferase n=1 Tax=Leifsonia poae TaxID=110933 RepID=UPI003D68F8E2
MSQARVVMWKSVWLPSTETFVAGQLASLRRWDATAVGIERRKSSLLTGDEVMLYGAGRVEALRRRLFVLTGRSRRLERVIRESGASLIHAHFAHEGFFVARAARRLRLPLVVSTYGSDVTSLPARGGPRGARFRRKLRRTFSTASLVLAVSESIAAKAIEYGADPGEVVVLRTGIPIPDRQELEGERSGILFVGRLVPKKGLEDLIDAVAALPDALRGVPVTVIGDGPLRPQLEAAAAAAGIDMTFRGAATQTEVLSAMASHRLLCVPSKTPADGDTEGLPTVIVQAGASLLPVVAYAHGGIPEIVVDGVTGVLVPEGDRPGLTAGIARLLDNPAVASDLAEGARRLVEREYSVTSQGQKLEDLYDMALVRFVQGR